MTEHLNANQTVVAEPYIGVKLMGLAPLLMGKRGQFLVDLYQYAREVDDVVDESPLPISEKQSYLDSQIAAVKGEAISRPPCRATDLYKSLDWSPVDKDHIQPKVIMILESIKDDLQHVGYKPRSEREIRHYNYRTIIPVFEGLLSVINNKKVGLTTRMVNLLEAYMQIGNLDGLHDDLAFGVEKLPTEYYEKSQDGVIPLVRKDKLKQAKDIAMNKAIRNITSILEMPEITLLQKTVFFSYFVQSLTKRLFKVYSA